jgi:hypothetical protein
MRFLKFVLTTAACVMSFASARAMTRYPGGCSVFSSSGATATVTLIDERKILLLTPPLGKPISLALPAVDPNEIGCSIFVSSDGRYFAIALNRLHSEAGTLHIIIADSAPAELAADAILKEDKVLGAPLTLLGFLQDSASLVVLGDNAGTHQKGFAVMQVDIHGKQSQPISRTVSEASAQVGNPNYADVKSNRLWFQSSPESCPLRSVPLIGSDLDSPTVTRAVCAAACDLLFARAYPSPNILILAATREPKDLVWRVDLSSQTSEQSELPQPVGHGVYTSVERAVSSPDGQLIAVLRNLLSNSLLGDAHSRGQEIDIMQVSPLKIVGTVRLKSDTDPASISIDHRNGAATVLSFQDGRWLSQSLKAP